jgi:hypothetical protein
MGGLSRGGAASRDAEAATEEQGDNSRGGFRISECKMINEK